MPPQVDPYADVKCLPHRKLPSLESLAHREAPANLERTVKLVHVGLRRVAIEARGVRDAKGEAVGIFQRLNFTLGDDRRPSLSAQSIALIVTDIAETFARQRDHLVNFRIHLQWLEDGGKAQEKQVRFTVDPSRLPDEDGDEEDEDEDDEEYEDDEGDHDDEEDEDDAEDDDNDDPESEADDEVEYEPERAPPPRQRVMRQRELPPARDTATPYVDQSLMGPIQPAMQVHSAVAEAQSMGLQPDLSNGLPLQANAMFFLQIMERNNATIARIWADQARQQRRDRRLARREFTTTTRELRRMAMSVVAEARADRDAARRHAENLGQQIIDSAALNRELYENHMRIAAHSWKAFRHSMDQEASMASTIMRYERALFDERLAHAERQVESEPPQWPGMVQTAVPIALGVMAHISKKKGHEDLYEMFKTMATNMSARHAANDDEVEEDDDEVDQNLGSRVVDTDATEPPPPQPVYQQPSAIRDQCRELLETIDPDQTTKLRKELPEGAWDSFEKITNAQTDSSARLLVSRLDSMIRKDVMAQTAVMQILRSDQTKKIFEIVRMNERKRMPPRPRASSEAATG